MTQTEKTLEHLRTYGSITPLEAMERYGIYRLGARVWDLRRQGVPVMASIEKGKNRDGEPVRYARYWLKEGS